MNCAIIFILLLIVIGLYLLYDKQLTEGFSSDEAVQNLASLYNQSAMTVTNLTSTGSGNFNNIATTGTATIPTLKATNVTASNGIVGKTGTISGALSTGTLNAQTANITGNGTTTGNFTIGGILSPTREQVIVINVTSSSAWNKTQWIAAITNGNYFTRSMPDGTLLKFLFVYNNNNKMSYEYAHAVKVGNIFLYTEIFNTSNIPNPATNASNDLGNRGNIN